ncbi:MAG: translation initiation factor [Flavobacteriaceae bacterium]
MKNKKLNSLEALGQIAFNDLAPDPENYMAPEEVPQKQFLEAHFSNKGRAGKTVTVIKGFEGDQDELKNLAKTLKQTLGSGGTVKDGEIIIQGNYREVLMEKLREMGHDVKRVGG